MDVVRAVYETSTQEGISDESVYPGIYRATRKIRCSARNRAGEGRDHGDGEDEDEGEGENRDR